VTRKENLKLKWIRNSKRWERKKKKKITVNTRDGLVVCFSKELIMQKRVSGNTLKEIIKARDLNLLFTRVYCL
jgi:hypothetical protein